MSAAKSGERAGNFLVSDLDTALVRAGFPAFIRAASGQPNRQ